MSKFQKIEGVFVVNEDVADLPGPLGPPPTEKEIAILRGPFPDHAYKEYKDKGSFVDLKAGFVYDRLLEAYGDGLVRIRGSYAFPVEVKEITYVLFSGSLDVLKHAPEVTIGDGSLIRFSLPLSGAWKIGSPQDLGDAMKSVVTNAISKATNTMLGMAADLFKGEINLSGGKVVRGKGKADPPPALVSASKDAPGVKLREDAVNWVVGKFGKDPANGKILIQKWWDATHPGTEAPRLSQMSDSDIARFVKEVVRAEEKK